MASGNWFLPWNSPLSVMSDLKDKEGEQEHQDSSSGYGSPSPRFDEGTSPTFGNDSVFFPVDQEWKIPEECLTPGFWTDKGKTEGLKNLWGQGLKTPTSSLGSGRYSSVSSSGSEGEVTSFMGVPLGNCVFAERPPEYPTPIGPPASNARRYYPNNRADADHFALQYGIGSKPKVSVYYRARKGKYRKEF